MVMPTERQRRALAKLDPGMIAARRAGPGFQQVKLCNCARCGAELIGESDGASGHHSTYYALPVMFGRLLGRPYCSKCYREVEKMQRRHE